MAKPLTRLAASAARHPPAARAVRFTHFFAGMKNLGIESPHPAHLRCAQMSHPPHRADARGEGWSLRLLFCDSRETTKRGGEGGSAIDRLIDREMIDARCEASSYGGAEGGGLVWRASRRPSRP